MTPDEATAFLNERTTLITADLAAFAADYAGPVTDNPHNLTAWQTVQPLMPRAEFARGWAHFDGRTLNYCPQMIATATAPLTTTGPASAEVYVRLIEAIWALTINAVIGLGSDPGSAAESAVDHVTQNQGVTEFMFMVEAEAAGNVFDEPCLNDGSWAADLGLAP